MLAIYRYLMLLLFCFEMLHVCVTTGVCRFVCMSQSSNFHPRPEHEHHHHHHQHLIIFSDILIRLKYISFHASDEDYLFISFAFVVVAGVVIVTVANMANVTNVVFAAIETFDTPISGCFGLIEQSFVANSMIVISALRTYVCLNWYLFVCT